MSDHNTTEHRSLLGKAENIASKIHGAADSISGAFNTKVDQAVHGKSLEKDRGKINRGQEEWNTGKFAHMADRHYDNPSNMESLRKHPQSHAVLADQTASAPVFKAEQEAVHPAGTAMGQAPIAPQEYGHVPQYPGDQNAVESRHGLAAAAYRDQFGNNAPPATSSHDVNAPPMMHGAGSGPIPPGEPALRDVHHYSAEQQRPYP